MGFISESIKIKWIIDILILIGVAYFIAIPQTIGGECNFLKPNCDAESYCGIDNTCHKFPYQDVIEQKTTTQAKSTIVVPALISLGIITLAIWYKRNDSIKVKRKNAQ